MKLYVYDHCPYCVKARMIFGYKNILFELVTLLNDDVATPTKLIGKKMVPILKEGDMITPESLDIVKMIDEKFYPLFLSKENLDKDLNQWLLDSKEYLYLLSMPRWVTSDLDEFKTQSSIDYFIEKKENYIGSFKEHLENSNLHLKKANKHLLKLENMMTESDFFSGDKASLNDINLYPTLRSLSIVRGVMFPKKVFSYMKKQEKLTKIPLHIDIST